MPDIEYRRLEPVTVYAATGVVPAGADVPPVIDRIAPPLRAALEAAGVEYREPGIFWYEMLGDGEGMRVWVSWIAGDEPVAGDGWQVVELPAVQRAAVTTYRGEMSGIGDAWGGFMEAVSADGGTFDGPAREVYLQAEGPQSTWVTELQQPLA